jgi:hypothetical protein
MSKHAAMVRGHSQVALAALAIVAINLSGCAAIKGIFKAGVWVGVIGVVLLVALVAGIGKMFASR